MLIKEDSIKRWIDSFYGYGSWNARFWLVAHEDGGGDFPEEVAAKLDYFDTAHPIINSPTLCDIRSLYKHVPHPIDGPHAGRQTTLYDHRFGSDGSSHGGWKNLISFVHGYQNKKLPDLQKYQRTSFVLNDEAFIQLYPLPSPHNHAWYYSWVDIPGLSFIRRREEYVKHLYPARIQTILEKLAANQPEVVLMYGMNNINQIKESVIKLFPATKFRLEKSVKMKIPQHHRAELNATKLVITTQIPTLRHNRVETGFDWYAFGKSVGK